MARILPELDELLLKRLDSKAEATVYRKCAELASDCIVLFSVPWINVTPYGTPRDGETDFIVFHRAKGILVIEVKGGGVVVDPSTDDWTSRDYYGEAHSIKNPFKQAKDSKHALIRYLRQEEEWPHLGIRPVFGHAVLFPDLSDAQPLVGPDRPPEIAGTASELHDFPQWINSVYDYWTGEDTSSVSELGKVGMEYVRRHFCQVVEVKPLLSTVLQDEEQERIRLTEEQRRIVAALRQRPRAAIAGGAGTGKTLLALGRSRELAKQGTRTLLLCFNQPLADQLNCATSDLDDLDAMSFHQLCRWFNDVAETHTGVNYIERIQSEEPNRDLFHYCFPLALAEAIPHVDIDYEAIVIDEAQDFRDEYWLPIEVFTEDAPDKHLLIFYDHNQQIYTRSSLFPIDEPPFVLTRNCRNTQFIHKLAYHYYQGIATEPSSIPGEAVELIAGPSRASQAKRLHSKLTDLLTKERVAGGDICVLVPSSNSDEFISLLSSKPLPAGVTWSINEMGHRDQVCIETVMRFKGLEATYIFFWGADEFDAGNDVELLYVTLSRAKSRICLVGERAACESLLP